MILFLKFHNASCFSSDLFEDWPKANDTAVSVSIALTADASSSRASTANVPRGDRGSRADSSSTRQSRSRATSARRSRRRRPVDVGAPRKGSKRAKINVEHALAVPSPLDGTLSAADFDQSKWKIMYPCFVEESLIDPFGRVNKKNI